MKEPITLDLLKRRVAGFFSPSDRKFFGKQRFSIYKNILIVRMVRKLSDHRDYVSFAAYRPNRNITDLNWVANSNSRHHIIHLIDEILKNKVKGMYNLPTPFTWDN